MSAAASVWEGFTQPPNAHKSSAAPCEKGNRISHLCQDSCCCNTLTPLIVDLTEHGLTLWSPMTWTERARGGDRLSFTNLEPWLVWKFCSALGPVWCLIHCLYISTIDSLGPEVDCGFKSWLHHTLALHLWVGYVTFLWFHCNRDKMNIIRIMANRNMVRNKCDLPCKHLRVMPWVYNKYSININ